MARGRPARPGVMRWGGVDDVRVVPGTGGCALPVTPREHISPLAWRPWPACRPFNGFAGFVSWVLHRCHEKESGSLDLESGAPYQPATRRAAPAGGRFGGVAQLVRAPACHAGGRGFEPRHSRQSSQRFAPLPRFAVMLSRYSAPHFRRPLDRRCAQWPPALPRGRRDELRSAI